ncbi:hypothetical protein FM104_14055 [Microbacterium esteraromaticum]|uniref:Uncharacterized protein n=1 Tax=Microbacterium esteraromaticum TaxID=57043 RepID=A0A1R4KME7_9MICO|nr:hypothetical protein FM104_14055 [Microbacterium esteraromaticum]
MLQLLRSHGGALRGGTAAESASDQQSARRSGRSSADRSSVERCGSGEGFVSATVTVTGHAAPPRFPGSR